MLLSCTKSMPSFGFHYSQTKFHNFTMTQKALLRLDITYNSSFMPPTVLLTAESCQNAVPHFKCHLLGKVCVVLSPGAARCLSSFSVSSLFPQ